MRIYYLQLVAGGERMREYADIDDLIFAEEVSLPSDR